MIPPAERTLPRLLLRQAERHGPRPLFSCAGTTWSYADMPGLAARSAGRLAAAGIARGDRVAIMSDNRPEFLELLLGCAWLGAIAVPINVASRGLQLQHVIDTADPAVIVTAPGLDAFIPHGARRHWPIDALPPPSDALPPADLGPGDTLAILFTSGTTGPSKGVCCPHAQLYWWGLNTARLLAITADDVLVTPLPLFHVNAMNTFWQALLHGARMELLPRFSVSAFWDAMATTGATVTYLLGAMVPMLLSRAADPAERAHRLRIALAPGVPPAVHTTFAERTGLRFIDGYGSTETNFVIGTTLDAQTPGLMGPAAPGFSARVVDPDDNDVADDTPGELILRADEAFAFATGYWRNDAATVAAWRNLWFHTGDRVLRDPSGRFRFLDRMKDAIRRRGENISAWEVEQALATHPAIASAAVFPVPSDLGEDEVMAAIIPHVDVPLSPADIIAHCIPLLPRFALPRYIDLVDSLPMTENGKVQKFKLTARGPTATTWDRLAKDS